MVATGSGCVTYCKCLALATKAALGVTDAQIGNHRGGIRRSQDLVVFFLCFSVATRPALRVTLLEIGNDNGPRYALRLPPFISPQWIRPGMQRRRQDDRYVAPIHTGAGRLVILPPLVYLGWVVKVGLKCPDTWNPLTGRLETTRKITIVYLFPRVNCIYYTY